MRELLIEIGANPTREGLLDTPSVLFDAVAVILSDNGAKALSMEGAAIDFVRDAFGLVKTRRSEQALLKCRELCVTPYRLTENICAYFPCQMDAVRIPTQILRFDRRNL